MDEIITYRTAAGLWSRNPVESNHSIANLGFQSFGLLRQTIVPDKERLIKNLNSNEEICKPWQGNDELRLRFLLNVQQIFFKNYV